MRLSKSAFLLMQLLASVTFGQTPNRALRDMQQEIDDLRQKVHCYETERDILEEKIHKQEASLSKLQKDLASSQSSSQTLSHNKITQLENRIDSLEKKNESLLTDLKSLRAHANETTTSLTTFNGKIGELEQNLTHNVTHLKGAVESLVKAMQKGTPLDGTTEMRGSTKIYHVKAGDSLERIAKNNKVSVDKIKKLNSLSKDRITIGQELILEE